MQCLEPVLVTLFALNRRWHSYAGPTLPPALLPFGCASALRTAPSLRSKASASHRCVSPTYTTHPVVRARTVQLVTVIHSFLSEYHCLNSIQGQVHHPVCIPTLHPVTGTPPCMNDKHAVNSEHVLLSCHARYMPVRRAYLHSVALACLAGILACTCFLNTGVVQGWQTPSEVAPLYKHPWHFAHSALGSPRVAVVLATIFVSTAASLRPGWLLLSTAASLRPGLFLL